MQITLFHSKAAPHHTLNATGGPQATCWLTRVEGTDGRGSVRWSSCTQAYFFHIAHYQTRSMQIHKSLVFMAYVPHISHATR